MNSYQYQISLRVRHPSIDPAEITSVLGLNPSRSWQAGKPRTTPKDTPLEGNWRESRWTARLVEGMWSGERYPRSGKALTIAVGEVLDQLTSHRAFFHRLRSEGGRTEFFVGWDFDGNSGDVFDCELLARMADMKIDLSLDIYPPDESCSPSNA